MTNAEINLAIAKIEFPNDEGLHITSDGATVYVPSEQEGRNYCEWWADIGEIIERERMKIVPLMEKYRVSKGDVYAQDHSLTKAAALCYLKLNTTH